MRLGVGCLAERSKRIRYVVPVLLKYCPHCFSKVILRSRRDRFPETVLRLFFIHRYRCRDCDARFYRFRTPFVKTLQAVKPRSASSTLHHFSDLNKLASADLASNRFEFDLRRLDSDVEKTRLQITAWADRQIVKSQWESQFAAMRGLSTEGCIIHFFFASIALALVLLL
jgi:transcriptional regulator NrdR family protein